MSETIKTGTMSLNQLFSPETLPDFLKSDPGYILNRVCMRAAGIDKGAQKYAGLPGIRLLDLKLVFYCVITVDKQSFTAFPVTYGIMEQLNTDETGLFRCAMKNSPYLLPYSFHEIGNEFFNGNKGGAKEAVSPNFTAGSFPPGPECPGKMPRLFFLSNVTGVFGASALFYRNLLPFLSKALGGDLFILPSSVHEVLLIRAVEEYDAAGLKEIVSKVNSSILDENDILSENVYRYHIKSCMLSAEGEGREIELKALW